MTLREMSVEYRAQAQALRGRMQELEKAWKQTGDPAERAKLEGRRWRSSGGRPGIRRFCWSVTMKGGTTAMKSIRYRRGRENERDLAVYTRLMAEDNGSQLQQLRRNLAQALREEVTERQKQVLFLYYNQGLTMREIGAALGVDRSTVSRTIKRGEARLHRCLRYGGAALLRGSLGEEGRKNFRHAVDKRVFRGR